MAIRSPGPSMRQLHARYPTVTGLGHFEFANSIYYVDRGLDDVSAPRPPRPPRLRDHPGPLCCSSEVEILSHTWLKWISPHR